MIILLQFGTFFLLSSLFWTCTKGQRRQLVTPPAQKNSRKEQQPSSMKDSFKDVFTKSEKKSDKSSKRESEKPKSGGRGEPRDTLVKKWETSSSRKFKSSLRPAGRNSLQTEPPTSPRESKSRAPSIADQMEQRSSSRRKQIERSQPQRRDTKEEEQMSSYRSNRLPSLAPTFGTSGPNKNTDNSSARVYRSKALPPNSMEPAKAEELPQKRLSSHRSQRSSSRSSKSVKSAKQKSMMKSEESKKEKSSKRVKEEASPWEKLVLKGKKKGKKESASSRRSKKSKGASKKSKSSKRSTREGISKKLFTKPKDKNKN